MSVYVNVRNIDNENYVENVNIDNMTVDDLYDFLTENNINDYELYDITFDGIDQYINGDYDVETIVELKDKYFEVDIAPEILQEIWDEYEDIEETLDKAEDVNDLGVQEDDILVSLINEWGYDFSKAYDIVSNGYYTVFDDYDSLGRYYAFELHDDVPDWLEYYIDYEELGKDYFTDDEYGIEGAFGYYIIAE